MSEGKKKKRKKRVVRSKAERIADLERKLQEEKAKAALEGLKTAIKDGNVSDENKKEYRKALRQLKAIEKAPGVLAEFDKNDEADVLDKLRQKLIVKLQNLMEEPSDSDEDEDDLEEEGDEDEDDDDEDDDEDDDDDDDDE